MNNSAIYFKRDKICTTYKDKMHKKSLRHGVLMNIFMPLTRTDNQIKPSKHKHPKFTQSTLERLTRLSSKNNFSFDKKRSLTAEINSTL